MSAPHRRLLKAGALLPLAAVSAAWTLSMAGVGGPAVVLADSPQPAPATLPDGTSLPAQAIEEPASVTGEVGSLGGFLGDAGDATQIVSSATTSGIPSVALAAYQRAETIINSADAGCRLPWQLVAAIGRVESNHGRAGGNVLGDDGLATPGIYGVALDGTSTALINDTDGGAYDNDTMYDRAVGPLQFIPSTWSVVGVDADGDGQRNPQDINDAALASAVYLCSGDDDLSTTAGQQASVLRYNHSQSYVDLVLSVMQAYLSGDFTTIPNSAVAAGILVPEAGPVSTPSPTTKDKIVSLGKDKKSGPTTPAAPTPTPTPTPTPNGGTGGDTGNGGGGTDNGGGGNGGGGGTGGVKVQVPGGPTVTVPALPTAGATPVDKALTLAEATVQCTLDGLVQLTQPAAFDQCVAAYMNP